VETLPVCGVLCVAVQNFSFKKILTGACVIHNYCWVRM
jgi:hypothetical protein